MSREQNDSNEVAITCDLADENMMDNYGVAYGNDISKNLVNTKGYGVFAGKKVEV